MSCETATAAKSTTKSIGGTPVLPNDVSREVSHVKMSEYDVLLGRGGGMNQRRQGTLYRKLLIENHEEYATLEMKLKRTFAWNRIIHPITSLGGHFLVYNDEKKTWIEAPWKQVATAVMQALRDCKRTNYGKSDILGPTWVSKSVSNVDAGKSFSSVCAVRTGKNRGQKTAKKSKGKAGSPAKATRAVSRKNIKPREGNFCRESSKINHKITPAGQVNEVQSVGTIRDIASHQAWDFNGVVAKKAPHVGCETKQDYMANTRPASESLPAPRLLSPSSDFEGGYQHQLQSKQPQQQYQQLQLYQQVQPHQQAQPDQQVQTHQQVHQNQQLQRHHQIQPKQLQQQQVRQQQQQERPQQQVQGHQLQTQQHVQQQQQQQQQQQVRQQQQQQVRQQQQHPPQNPHDMNSHNFASAPDSGMSTFFDPIRESDFRQWEAPAMTRASSHAVSPSFEPDSIPALSARVHQLEQLVHDLRAENQKLRGELSQVPEPQPIAWGI